MDGAENKRKGGGGNGKKQQRADASNDRGEDLDRLKNGFLGRKKAVGGSENSGTKSLVAASSSVQDFLQPKKKKKK